MFLERAAIEGNSPVNENSFLLFVFIPEYFKERQPWRKQAGLNCQG